MNQLPVVIVLIFCVVVVNSYTKHSSLCYRRSVNKLSMAVELDQAVVVNPRVVDGGLSQLLGNTCDLSGFLCLFVLSVLSLDLYIPFFLQFLSFYRQNEKILIIDDSNDSQKQTKKYLDGSSTMILISSTPIISNNSSTTTADVNTTNNENELHVYINNNIMHTILMQQ